VTPKFVNTANFGLIDQYQSVEKTFLAKIVAKDSNLEVL